MSVLGEFNERAISIEAVNEMKSGKAPGQDGFLVKCLKKDGLTVLAWQC